VEYAEIIFNLREVHLLFMGIGGWLKRKLKKEDEVLEEEELKEPMGPRELGEVTAENMQAKVELIMARMDSLSTQQAAINERIKNIERLVTEIRSFCR